MATLRKGSTGQDVRELQTAVSTQGASTDSYRSFAIALANDGKIKEAQSTLETLQERGASSGDCGKRDVGEPARGNAEQHPGADNK